jgi:hypothetical protein
MEKFSYGVVAMTVVFNNNLLIADLIFEISLGASLGMLCALRLVAHATSWLLGKREPEETAST